MSLRLAALVGLLCALTPDSANSQRIERSTLQAMFDHAEAINDWQIRDTCLWGYFFTDRRLEALERAAEELVKAGYTFVRVLEPELEQGEARYYFLHVERVERHSVDSLHLRNAALYEFADRHNLGGYDGMDVGPLEDGECTK
ncbi:MAG: ribonuclease E inhibitor RraB [Pseudomonadota bacterium]